MYLNAHARSMSRKSKDKAVDDVDDAIRHPSIAFEIQKGLACLREDNTCTDFEVVVHGRSFQCHKAVLASISDYFKAMFLSGMKETVNNRATLDNISSDAFQTVLDLIYPKDGDTNPLCSCTEYELGELLRIADMLQIKCLSRICLVQFEDTMAPVNCFGRWKTGMSILSDALGTMAWKYILANFDDVASCKRSDILNLDYEEFLSIVADDTLKVSSEISVWRIIADWISFRPNREEKLPELLKNCCLTEIDRVFLSENIAFDETVRSNSLASKLVQEAVKFQNHPGDHGNVELKLRRCLGKEQVRMLISSVEGKDMIAITKINSERRVTTTTHYNTTNKTFASCVHGQSLYLSGGTGGYETIMYEINEQGKWILCPGRMPIPLKHHVMVATDDSLYLLGGSSNDSCNKQVLQYKLSTKMWSCHGEVVSPVEHASAVCMNEKIYVFGGVLDAEPYLATDTVQMYDTQTKTATVLRSKLPSRCAFSGAIKRQGNVYVVTCNGEVVHLSGNNLETTELIATISDFKERKQFALTIEKSVLMIYGGFTLNDNGHKEISNRITGVGVPSGQILEQNKGPRRPMIFCGAQTIVTQSI